MTMYKRPYTKAGLAFRDSLTEWLQDTRLISEAVYRLKQDYKSKGDIEFAAVSWPKGKTGFELKDFKIDHPVLKQRMYELLEASWAAQFVFLESLWEEYLQGVIKDLRLKDAKIFEPFCERDFMAQIIRGVLSDSIASIDEIKDEVATRFAAGLTRKPWDEQWKQLEKLHIGLSDKDKEESWYKELDIYFEIRNCIIHRKSKVSPSLNKKTTFYRQKGTSKIVIWPPHLDHYRHQFLACLFHIEDKIKARFSNAAAA